MSQKPKQCGRSGEELRKRGINSWGEEKEIHLTARRQRKRTNSGGVAGAEGGS